ncbi:hypothetical protein ACVBEH_34405, partial [Roseateles sp. GG27B]
GVVEGSSIRREFRIIEGRLIGGGKGARAEIADYVPTTESRFIRGGLTFIPALAVGPAQLGRLRAVTGCA